MMVRRGTKKRLERRVSGEERHVPRFRLQLGRPARNSSIGFLGSTADPEWICRTYPSMHTQYLALGISVPDGVNVESDPDNTKGMKEVVNKTVTDWPGGGIRDDESFGFKLPSRITIGAPVLACTRTFEKIPMELEDLLVLCLNSTEGSTACC